MSKESFYLYKINGASVEEMPGIGPAHGGRLADNGYSRAVKLYGRYLLCDEDYSSFKQFLASHGVTYSNHRDNVCSTFRAWTEHHIG